MTPNRLINEKSPYLLQHAYNPVDWYPWGEEAFEKAKKENKPIFLSVGYSTCHWCHVMERESFEDEEVADILNKGFISIKVDREERPDIDSVYMNVCQALTGSGGWPLTVFLTPERTPFFAGTYFPKRSRYGRPGLIELLNMIREKWENERERLEGLGEQIFNSISEQMGESAPGEPGPELLHSCYRTMEKTFDPVYGGFGAAPKFPSPHHLLFLLRYWKRFGEGHALEMVERTLLGMYCGGIFDHIGLGFSRYSTDREWLVPHFEKMLYDNALLAIAYLEAYQATHKEFYASAARAIFTYILRDMTSRDGGFYTAEDADSEGVEGKFYLWTPQELKNTSLIVLTGCFRYTLLRLTSSSSSWRFTVICLWPNSISVLRSFTFEDFSRFFLSQSTSYVNCPTLRSSSATCCCSFFSSFSASDGPFLNIIRSSLCELFLPAAKHSWMDAVFGCDLIDGSFFTKNFNNHLSFKVG